MAGRITPSPDGLAPPPRFRSASVLRQLIGQDMVLPSSLLGDERLDCARRKSAWCPGYQSRMIDKSRSASTHWFRCPALSDGLTEREDATTDRRDIHWLGNPCVHNFILRRLSRGLPTATVDRFELQRGLSRVPMSTGRWMSAGYLPVDAKDSAPVSLFLMRGGAAIVHDTPSL